MFSSQENILKNSIAKELEREVGSYILQLDNLTKSIYRSHILRIEDLSSDIDGFSDEWSEILKDFKKNYKNYIPDFISNKNFGYSIGEILKNIILESEHLKFNYDFMNKYLDIDITDLTEEEIDNTINNKNFENNKFERSFVLKLSNSFLLATYNSIIKDYNYKEIELSTLLASIQHDLFISNIEKNLIELINKGIVLYNDYKDYVDLQNLDEIFTKVPYMFKNNKLSFIGILSLAARRNPEKIKFDFDDLLLLFGQKNFNFESFLEMNEQYKKIVRTSKDDSDENLNLSVNIFFRFFEDEKEQLFDNFINFLNLVTNNDKDKIRDILNDMINNTSVSSLVLALYETSGNYIFTDKFNINSKDLYNLFKGENFVNNIEDIVLSLSKEEIKLININKMLVKLKDNLLKNENIFDYKEYDKTRKLYDEFIKDIIRNVNNEDLINIISNFDNFEEFLKKEKHELPEESIYEESDVFSFVFRYWMKGSLNYTIRIPDTIKYKFESKELLLDKINRSKISREEFIEVMFYYFKEEYLTSKVYEFLEVLSLDKIALKLNRHLNIILDELKNLRDGDSEVFDVFYNSIGDMFDRVSLSYLMNGIIEVYGVKELDKRLTIDNDVDFDIRDYEELFGGDYSVLLSNYIFDEIVDTFSIGLNKIESELILNNFVVLLNDLNFNNILKGFSSLNKSLPFIEGVNVSNVLNDIELNGSNLVKFIKPVPLISEIFGSITGSLSVISPNEVAGPRGMMSSIGGLDNLNKSRIDGDGQNAMDLISGISSWSSESLERNESWSLEDKLNTEF